MRQIFSFRFVAALAALVGLLAVLVAARTQDAVPTASAGDPDSSIPRHRIDFVDHVFVVDNAGFTLTEDGFAAENTKVIIDGQRALTIVGGTPGEIDCPNYTEIGKCAIVADLLGEAVVWFALVPHTAGDTVRLPAIDVLEDDRAVLVNGWELPYAPILDRRCADKEWDSYRVMRADLGDQFTSLYDINEQRLVAVLCDTTVPWVTTTTSTTTTTTTVAPQVEPAATS